MGLKVFVANVSSDDAEIPNLNQEHISMTIIGSYLGDCNEDANKKSRAAIYS